MRWSSKIVLAALLFSAVPVFAETADDAYIRIYGSLQEADTLNRNGQVQVAAARYVEVQTALKRFQQIYPNWNQKIVSYRLSYATERLESIVKFLPPPVTPATEAPSTAPQSLPSVSFQLSSRKSAPKDELETKIEGLTSDVGRLENEKSRLEAKLKEALAMQPAAVDPAQLASARRKLSQLEKERDLLKVTLEQEQARTTKIEQNHIDPQMIKELEAERDDLRQQLADALSARTDTESRYQQRIRLAEEKLKQLDELQSERDELERQLQITLARAAVDVERKPTKAELKEFKQLQDQKEAAEMKFYTMAKELSALQSDREKELKAYQTALTRIQQLEVERYSLQVKVAGLQSVSPAVVSEAPQQSPMAGQLEELRSRLAVYEAKAIPFTPEELALFKKPGGTTASAYYLATRPTVRDLPPNSQKLVEQADNAFAEQRFGEAARKYKEVLAKNDSNVYTLANLASSQIELNQLDEATANLKRVLAVEPNDPFSLLLLGKIRMSENKMDEAMNALSLAAELNPDSAETQNCLGIVLSEKGLRVAAEAALRKAIQLQPDYASAHHNLAIIYATQKPPFVELARWHYEKAVSLGHVKNSELEKLVAGQ